MNNYTLSRLVYRDWEDYDEWALEVGEHPITWTAIMARSACLSFRANSEAE